MLWNFTRVDVEIEHRMTIDEVEIQDLIEKENEYVSELLSVLPNELSATELQPI
jgi:hypothetical protein